MKRALLVDDHDLFRQVLGVVLEEHTDLKENFQAGSLGEARLILADLHSRVDLAVIDLDLPGEDPTELIQDLHELEVPVLAFTADRSFERRDQALQAGACEILTTATPAEQIIETAARLVSG